MWSLSPPVLIALAATVAVASGASGSIGYSSGKSAGNELVLKMQNAGIEAMARRQTVITELKGKSRADANRIAKLSRDARVFICPEPHLPRPGDITDTDPPGDDRAVRTDITGILRQCHRSFGEINRIGSVK